MRRDDNWQGLWNMNDCDYWYKCQYLTKQEKSALIKSIKNTNKEERLHDGKETIHILTIAVRQKLLE